MEGLETKIMSIANKYADLVEMRLITALKESEVESKAMVEINDGIRMLNHIAATLERIKRLENPSI